MKNTKLKFLCFGRIIATMECTDFIPYDGDYITINDRKYMVITRIFDYDNNVITFHIR